MENTRTRVEYERRICLAMNFIADNPDRNLSLDEIAAEAHFSPFHFHRLFSALVGETVGDFSRRLRLERAARKLVYQPDCSVTEIALSCGFSSSQNFARAFRKRFSCSPRDYRLRHPMKVAMTAGSAELSKIGHRDHNNGHAMRWPWAQNWDTSSIRTRSSEMNVTLTKLPDQQVAYLRRIGPYGPDIGPLFERLCGWAGPRGLLADPETAPLAIYWDNPEMTAADKCRSDACVAVPEGTEVEGDIGLQTIPGGLCALYRTEAAPEDFPRAWEELLAGWLPDSGYQPDDRPCYEIYRETPDNHPRGKFVVDLCIAVKPL